MKTKKCRIKGCSHRGGAVINPEDPQGRYINMCLHHQVELFTEFSKRYYSQSKATIKQKLR
jgi:hypothetical protein